MSSSTQPAGHPDYLQQRGMNQRGAMSSTDDKGRVYRPMNQTGGALEQHPSGAPVPGSSQSVGKKGYCGSCNVTKVAVWVGTATALAALAAGIIGALVYTGVLSIALTNVGVMSKDIALYTMLGGFSVSFLIGVFAAVRYATSTPQKTVDLT